MAASARRPRRSSHAINTVQEQPQSQEYSNLLDETSRPRTAAAPEAISLPIDMILNLLFSYLQKHPELIEQVVEKLVGRLVASIQEWIDSKAQS
jgi:hypothetical protein